MMIPLSLLSLIVSIKAVEFAMNSSVCPVRPFRWKRSCPPASTTRELRLSMGMVDTASLMEDSLAPGIDCTIRFLGFSSVK